MADFELTFEKILKNEGGYTLNTIAGDTGGMTYAGISVNNFPTWIGWNLIDKNKNKKQQESLELVQLTKEFYKNHFWDKIRGDEIKNQKVAANICDFAVNAGIKTAILLAQRVLGITQDGIVGNDTLTKLNGITEEEFIYKYLIEKIKRYVGICDKNQEQKKFLLGWLKRALSE